MRKPLQAAALSALLFSFNGTTNAQTLPLDATFGTAGRANLGAIPAFYPLDMSLQTDGKILCMYGSSANTYALRVKSDGNIDNTFIADLSYQLWPTPVAGALQFTGKLCTPNEALIRETYDHKVIIAFGAAILRVTSTGSVDASFGNVSTAPGYLDLNSFAPVHPLAALHDMYDALSAGHYYAGPASVGIGNTDTVVIAKTTTSGVYDPAYGTGGQKLILLDSANFGYVNAIRRIKFTSTGKILVTGQSLRASSPATQGDVFVARFNLNGTPDATFGTGGVKIVDFGNLNQDPWSITCAANGDIYVSGVQDSSLLSVTRQYFTFKMSPSGVVDMTYGTGGVIVEAPGPYLSAYPMSITTTSYNKLYMAGFYSPSFMDYKNEYHAYTSTGGPNLSFAPGGMVNNNIYERSQKLLTQPLDNKILILAGDSSHPKLMRITGDQMPVQPNAVGSVTTEDRKAWVANNFAYIASPDAHAMLEATLTSIDGKRIKQYSNSDFVRSNNTGTVQLPKDLPTGIYILSVRQDGETHHVKFVN
jgi:uncharacterized delta-60 repeat protein